MRNPLLARFANIDTPDSPDTGRRPAVDRGIIGRTSGALRAVFSLGTADKKKKPHRPYQFSGAERLENRHVFSGDNVAAEVLCIDEPSTVEPECETVTEVRTIDFSTLEPGTHPESWTTTIEGLGRVRLWFEGGTTVDSHGVSAVRQPLGGTGWNIDFEDHTVKIISAELDFGGTSPRGMLRLKNNGDYIRENGRIVDFPLTQNVDFGGRMTNQISEGQDSGTVALRSLTAEVTVTRAINDDIADDLTDVLTEDERALREALGTLRQRLSQERITLTELQTLLTTAQTTVDQLTAEFAEVQRTTGLRTAEKNTAQTNLTSAQKALDTANTELRLVIGIVERAEASRRLVTSLEQQILDAARRIQEARKKESDALASLMKKPQDRILQQAYITARTQSALVFVTETRNEVQLRAALVAAKAQVAKDAPALQKALADKTALTVRVTSATVLRDTATIALDTAIRVLAESTECEKRSQEALATATTERVHAQNDVAAQRIVVDELIAAIQQKEASLAIIEQAKGERERTKSPTERMLLDLEALTAPWNIAGEADALKAADKRGIALTEAVEDLETLMAVGPDTLADEIDITALRTRMANIATKLKASIDEWNAVREDMLRPNSAVASIGTEMLSTAPRMSGTFTVSHPHSLLNVRIRSPYDQTYIEFEKRIGENTPIESTVISHPGGTENAAWSKLFERRTNVPGGEFFVRMYADAAKTVLLDSIDGSYSPDSNVGGIPTTAEFDTMGSKTMLALPSLGGEASLESFRGMMNTVPFMKAIDGGLRSHGSGFTLDLSGVEHLVTTVRFTVKSENGGPVTAQFYRGSTFIGSAEASADGMVDFSDTEGITGMLIANAMREMSPHARGLMEYMYTAEGRRNESRGGGAAPAYFGRNPHIPLADRSRIVEEVKQGFLPYNLSVTDLEILGSAYLPQVEAEPMSIRNNSDLSRIAHPYWEQSDETLRRSGYLALGRFGPNAYGLRRDINHYSAVQIHGVNGIARITNVAYHQGDSDTPLSRDYYEIFGNTVIIKPGAPGQVVMYFGKEGSGDVQGLNIDVEHRESMSSEGLVPPEGMSLRTNILAIRGPNAGEGVGPALTEIKDLGRPVTIGRGNLLMNVWNDGRIGGMVRVITNPNTPEAHEIAFSLGAGEGKAVAIDFLVPANGQLKIRTVLPDGTFIDDGKPLRTQGNEAEKRIAIKKPDGTYELKWVSIHDPRPTVSNATDYDPGFAAWKQQYIQRTGDTSVAEPANFGKAFVTYLETKKPQPLAERKEELLVAEQKLVAMIPGYIRAADIIEIDGHIDLGKREVIHLPNLSLQMQPERNKVIHFELTHDMMVNIDVPGVWDRNISLTIQSTKLPAGGYTSDKAENSGESISLRLPAGIYTCTVKDASKYDGLEFGHVVEKKPFSALINIDAVTYNSAEIVGRISIEGDPRVMPVSLRVAEFYSDTGKRKDDYTATSGIDKISKLDPNQPVWVVVHGMDDDEKGGMERVAKILKEYPGMQVVAIDWKKAADAFLITGNDAPWTKGVGEWIANQLLNLGFDPANINIAGHSHGTYVGYAMANKVMDTQYGAQINAFVALDPAGNIPALSGFKVGDMKFAQVSRNSIAIEGSLGAGNNALAETSDLAFQIDSSNTHTPFSEHSLPVETFISLLSLGKKAPASVPDYLKLDNILTPYDRQNIDLRRNFFRNYYEGIIAIDTRKAFDAYGKDYLFALPKSITTRHNGDENNDVDNFPSVDSIFA